MRSVVFLLFGGLLLPAMGHAADLNGMWVGRIPVGRNGDLQDIAFRLTQTGSAIGGKLYGDYKSSLIKEGTINGDEVIFVVMIQEQAGNQINETRFKYSGTLKDGELELTREREISTTAGNSSGAPSRNNAKAAFKLKRLY